MKEFDKVLNKDEKIIWEGQPKYWPFIITGAVPSFITGLILIVFMAPFLLVNLMMPTQEVVNSTQTTTAISVFFLGWNLFLIPFLLIALWLLIGSPVYKIILYHNLFFAISNQRIIVQNGIIGRDFSFIDLDKITNFEVKVGFWDKVIGNSSGSLQIFSAGTNMINRSQWGGAFVGNSYTFTNIANPYEVSKILKDVGSKKSKKD